MHVERMQAVDSIETVSNMFYVLIVSQFEIWKYIHSICDAVQVSCVVVLARSDLESDVVSGKNNQASASRAKQGSGNVPSFDSFHLCLLVPASSLVLVSIPRHVALLTSPDVILQFSSETRQVYCIARQARDRPHSATMPPKRKRATSAVSTKESATTDKTTSPNVQPSSRDASGEDTTDSVLRDVKERKNMDPPAKRTRASSSATAKSASSKVNGSSSASSSKMQIETGKAVEMPVNGTIDGSGEHGEAGTMRMEAPPKAGMVDPAGGYKTNPPPEDRPVRVYADGVFDLFHLGHMRQLQQAKTAFPKTQLIVGVTGDAETHKRKGLTVMSAKERAESVRHCRWVDEVIEDCPWIIDVPFLEANNIDYVAHDDLPYGAAEGDDIYKPIKEKGMFLVTQRTEGVSTTGIITKIVRDYEQYIARQLKRGTSRQELNVSWLKKNELDIKRHVSDLSKTIRNNWTTTGQELSRELRQFWQPSRPSSPAPSASSLRNGARSPLPTDRLSIGEGGRGGRAGTPQKSMDFAAGYAMGLIGGVKGWMEGSKRRNLSDSRAQSPEDSPIEDVGMSGVLVGEGEDVGGASGEGEGSSVVEEALRGRRSEGKERV